MKKVLSVLAFLAIGFSVIAQTKWTADPVHSSLGFSIKHLTISEVSGKFTKFDGSYTSAKANLIDIKINFIVDAASINTGEEKRDDDLRSDHFFDAQKYSYLKFESTSFKKINGKNYRLFGKLTIKDVTKDVSFTVVYGGTAKDPWGNTRSGFSATTTIDRFDYNINYDPTGLLVGKTVTLNLNMEFIKAK